MPSDLHGHPGEGVDDDVLQGRFAPGARGRALPVLDSHGRLVGWSHRSAPAAAHASPSATAAGSLVTDRPAGTDGAAAPNPSDEQVAAAVAAVAGADPGPALAAWVDSVDVSAVPVAIAVEAVAAAARMEAAARARTAALAAELSRREEMDPTWSRLAGAPPAQRSVAGDELAMRMGISRVAANQLVRQGLAFAGQLQATGEALACGHLDTAKAALLVRRLGDLPWQVAVAVEDRVLPGADRRTPAGLRADSEQALVEVEPGEAAARHEHARRHRRVTRPRVEDDGMASMWLVLAAEDAVRVDGVLDAVARSARACGDPRTGDQIRADGLRDLVVGDADDLAGGRDLAEGTDLAGGTGLAGGSHLATEVSHHDYVTPHGLSEITLFRPVTPDGDPISTGDGAGGAGGGTRLGTGLDSDDGRDGGAHDGPDDGRDGGAHDGQGADADVLRQAGVETSICPPSGVPDGPLPVPDLGRVTRVVPVTATGTHGTCACGASTAPRGRRGTRIDVTVAASTLAGLDDHPAHMHGYGPIDADTARALAADATWRRILTDAATGAVLDVGRTRYRPPAALAEHVRVRDRHCAAPGCTVPARRCHLDHTIEYHGGPDARTPDAAAARDRDGCGTTSADNLGPLCPRHHRLKTDGGFRLRQVAPGLFEWITPGGHRYRTRPGTDEITDLTAIAVWTGADTGPIRF